MSKQRCDLWKCWSSDMCMHVQGTRCVFFIHTASPYLVDGSRDLLTFSHTCTLYNHIIHMQKIRFAWQGTPCILEHVKTAEVLKVAHNLYLQGPASVCSQVSCLTQRSS